MPNFRSAGAEIFDSEKGIGRKENRAAGAKKTAFCIRNAHQKQLKFFLY